MNRRWATLSTNLIVVTNLFCEGPWSAKFILRRPFGVQNLFCVSQIDNVFWECSLCIPTWHKSTLFNRETLYKQRREASRLYNRNNPFF